MMTLESNKVKMYYAQYLGVSPEYMLDSNGNRIIDYIDDDGEVVYLETGKNISVYSEPQEMSASISESGGDAQPQEYGLSIADYQAILLYGRNEYHVKEGDIIEIKLGERITKAEVTAVAEHITKNDASSLYRIIE